jgi:hypothetical protein
MRLKLRCRGNLPLHDIPADFYESLLTASKVISDGHTDGQANNMVIS